MAKASPSQKDKSSGSFPVPFSIKEFREDITNVFLHYVRDICWMTDEETAWAITKVAKPESNLCNPDCTAEDLGLAYDDIRHTEFAKALERLYDYAYFGKLDSSAEVLEDESIHTWITALVCDAAESSVAMEWAAYGLDVVPSAKRCAVVAEVANARVTLEGNEPFYTRFQGWTTEGYLVSDFLTVRQFALLAGMEEMSVRAAANPSRPNPIKTVKTDQGTRIEIAVAKDWLQAKGRYIPVTKFWSEGTIDLAKQRFTNLPEFDAALCRQYRIQAGKLGQTEIDSALKACGISVGQGIGFPVLNLSEADYSSETTLGALAKILELPGHLLFLRTQEVLAYEKLRGIEQELREVTQDNTKPNQRT